MLVHVNVTALWRDPWFWALLRLMAIMWRPTVIPPQPPHLPWTTVDQTMENCMQVRTESSGTRTRCDVRRSDSVVSSESPVYRRRPSTLAGRWMCLRQWPSCMRLESPCLARPRPSTTSSPQPICSSTISLRARRLKDRECFPPQIKL